MTNAINVDEELVVMKQSIEALKKSIKDKNL